jgi:hypothetical protein
MMVGTAGGTATEMRIAHAHGIARRMTLASAAAVEDTNTDMRR